MCVCYVYVCIVNEILHYIIWKLYYSHGDLTVSKALHPLTKCVCPIVRRRRRRLRWRRSRWRHSGRWRATAATTATTARRLVNSWPRGVGGVGGGGGGCGGGGGYRYYCYKVGDVHATAAADRYWCFPVRSSVRPSVAAAVMSGTARHAHVRVLILHYVSCTYTCVPMMYHVRCVHRI